jgi:hypothetical protein
MEWLLDVIIRYLIFLFRSAIRMAVARGSGEWPVVKASVTGSSCYSRSLGPLAEVTYAYTYKGEPFTGMNREPFILCSSAEEYVTRFREGGDLIVRVKPADPEMSTVRQRDQTIGILK